MRSAVVYATAAVVLVAVPVLALPGIAGRLFAPLAISYGLATLASLIVALTVDACFRHGALSAAPMRSQRTRRCCAGRVGAMRRC